MDTTRHSDSSASAGQRRQATLRDLVTDAVREEPRKLAEVYAIVARIRPETPNHSIRARIYEQVEAGRILRVVEGVYVAVDGPARMLLVHGDAWDLLPQFPEGVLNAIVTDHAYDMGTKVNAETGTTRPHGTHGRTYDVKDLDEAWFRAAFRALRKDHEWRGLNGGTTPGGGACFIFSPPRTAQTAPHIDALRALAEKCGFVFQCEMVWDYGDRGMGYWPPQEHQLLHLFTAGERAGVPHDLTITSIIREKRLRRVSSAEAEEHEAEKPVGLFLKMLRFVSRPGDLVLDCFAGRARWAREAVARGWNVVLIEREERWVREIRDDWPPATAAGGA
jgi:DNA modification methylase